MSRGSQKKVRTQPVAREIPAWARDNLVLKLLDDKGMRLEVMYDQKYLNGLENQPLIVIRRKR
jgi:hypothetical protein